MCDPAERSVATCKSIVSDHVNLCDREGPCVYGIFLGSCRCDAASLERALHGIVWSREGRACDVCDHSGRAVATCKCIVRCLVKLAIARDRVCAPSWGRAISARLRASEHRIRPFDRARLGRAKCVFPRTAPLRLARVSCKIVWSQAFVPLIAAGMSNTQRLRA